MPQPVAIRALTAVDRADWDRLWAGYLAFYKTALPPATTDLTWQRLLDPAEPVHGLGAILDGRLAGIVHYVFHRATWSATHYCYLEDLFTDETCRGHGVGRALIEAVYRAADVHGASRVYWLTHETNATARTLYDQVASFDGFIQYRRRTP